MTKPCVKCGSTKRGRTGYCKDCASAYAKAKYAINAETNKAAATAYRLANPEIVKARLKAWRDNNKQHINGYKASYRLEKPEMEKASQTAYRKANKAKMKRAIATWKEKNAIHVSEYQKRKWHEVKATKLAQRKQRYRDDPIYSMCVNVRNRTSAAFRNNGFSKTSKTFELIGCDWPSLKDHIEKQFVSGMGWDNKREWHVDHIVPIGSAKTVADIKALCHFTNLRPMWATENLKKNGNHIFLI